VNSGAYICAMPQLASYLRAIGCRATISSDRITARLANGPGLSVPRCTFLPLFLNFPDTPLVSVTTITLIIALRRTVPSRLPNCCGSVGNFNFRIKNANVINHLDILSQGKMECASCTSMNCTMYLRCVKIIIISLLSIMIQLRNY